MHQSWWWDKLHRDIRQDEITIGVAAFRDEKGLTVGKLLALPFREQRTLKLPLTALVALPVDGIKDVMPCSTVSLDTSPFVEPDEEQGAAPHCLRE